MFRKNKFLSIILTLLLNKLTIINLLRWWKSNSLKIMMLLTEMKMSYFLNRDVILAMYLKRAWASLMTEMVLRGVKVRLSEEKS
jgi:hypothetical protein